MDALLSALSKIGGLAVIGALIDHAMRKHEKEQLINWLIVWWDRFDSVRWDNFSRREAELAIGLLDRYVGNRLWSWKRWRFVIVVSGIIYLSAILWTIIRIWWYAIVNHKPSVLDVGAIFDLSKDSQWLSLLLIVVLFAVSLSVTRAISRAAVFLSVSTITTIFTFLGLLALHLLLFLVWNGAVLELGRYVSYSFESCLVDQSIASCIASTLKTINAPLALFGKYLTAVWSVFTVLGFEIIEKIFSVIPNPSDTYSAIAVETYARIMDILANGLRIVLALVFLGSFVFRPLIQAPISRLWAALIESEKPIFATLFACAGVLLELINVISE